VGQDGPLRKAGAQSRKFLQFKAGVRREEGLRKRADLSAKGDGAFPSLKAGRCGRLEEGEGEEWKSRRLSPAENKKEMQRDDCRKGENRVQLTEIGKMSGEGYRRGCLSDDCPWGVGVP